MGVTDTLMRVRGVNEFGPVVREVKGQIGDLDRTAQSVGASIGGNLGGMIAGGLGAVAVGAIIDTGMELTKLGAQAIRVEDGFRNLMTSIGSTSEQALGKLRAASLNTIDDTNLMLSSNRAVMLGVADSADELARLLSAAAARGRNLGVGTEQAFNDIVTGIGRMSPMILDNLGIVTGGEKAFEEYAKSINKTAEELTDGEKKQFLINKVLSDAIPLTADAATGWERLAAATENAKTSFGKALASFADASNLSSWLDQVSRALDVAAVLNAARAKAGVSAGVENMFLVAGANIKAAFGVANTAVEAYAYQLQQIDNAWQSGSISDGEAVRQVTELSEKFSTMGSIVQSSVIGAMSQLDQESRKVAEILASGVAGAMGQVNTDALIMAGSISVASNAMLTMGSAAGLASDQLRSMAPGFSAVTAQADRLRALAESKALSLVPTMGIEGARGVWKTAGDMVDEYIYRVQRAGVTEEESKLQAAATAAAINDLGVAYKTTAGAVDTYDDALNRLRGSVESAIGGAISGTKSLMDFSAEGMVGSFDPNGPARNFGRMWDVAVNGFRSQWLEPLRQEGLIPDDVIAQGEDAIKRFAEGKARAFQAGTDLGMLDKEAIKRQVMQQIAAEAELAKMRDQILAELAGQGINRTAAAGALDTVLGQQGMAPTGQAGATGYAEGFSSGLIGQGSKIVAVLATEIEENKGGFDTVGRTAGTLWGEGFLAVVGDNVPAPLITLLVSLVTPGVMARVAAENNRRGPVP